MLVTGVLRRAVRGALGGIVATGAMSLFMLGAQQVVSRGRMGPKQITQQMVEAVGSSPPEPALNLLTFVNHFAYGTGMAALFGALTTRPRSRPRRAVEGVLFAHLVWAASYKGWIPALDIMPAPEQDLPERAVRVYAAHWVYGIVLGAVVS